MRHYTYILYSAKLNRFYKGYTADVYARFDKHNKGDVTFTSKGRPWILVWACEKPTKQEALRLEIKLKNLGSERTRDFILKYDDNMPSPDVAELIRALIWP